MALSQKRLEELIDYNPLTGEIRWIKPNCTKIKIGDVAGNINVVSGVRYIVIDRKHYKAHRLCYLFMTGKWPANDIDHIGPDRQMTKEEAM